MCVCVCHRQYTAVCHRRALSPLSLSGTVSVLSFVVSVSVEAPPTAVHLPSVYICMLYAAYIAYCLLYIYYKCIPQFAVYRLLCSLGACRYRRVRVLCLFIYKAHYLQSTPTGQHYISTSEPTHNPTAPATCIFTLGCCLRLHSPF